MAVTITTGLGLPALSKKLVDRILSDQYVDFADFPPAKGRTHPMPVVDEGHIIAEDINPTRKLIPDLLTCFTLYLAVITEKEPSNIKRLEAYINTTVKASMKYKWPSWIVSKVDPSTYTQCFINAAASNENWCKVCQSINHATDVCPCKWRVQKERCRVPGARIR